MLDTLIECAPPGRRRPTLREVANVLRHGHRAQFGRPGRSGVLVLAVFVAAAAAFLGAAAGNRIGWEAVGPLPDNTEINETVFPGMRVWGGGDAAKIVSQSDGEGVESGYAVSWVRHTAATRDVPRFTASVRARLEAAGWTVDRVDPAFDRDYVSADPADDSAGFAAHRGDLGLRFDDFYWAGLPAYDGDGAATYLIWHRTPSWLVAFGWAGAVLAALAAWFLTAWVSRTLEVLPELNGLFAAGAVFFVLGVTPAALLAIPAENGASETVAPFWQHLVHLGLFPAVLAACAAVLLLGAAVLVRSRQVIKRSAERATARSLARAASGWPAQLPNSATPPAEPPQPAGSPQPGGGWRRLPRRRTALVVVAAVLIGAAVHNVIPGSCSPAAPAGIIDPPEAAMSYDARVFIAPDATDDQRNLAQAAIGRGMGGGFTFNAGHHSSGFSDAFCGYGRVSASDGARLPWFWTVSLASPGMFDGLAAEVSPMPGVVAVEHLPGGFTIIGS